MSTAQDRAYETIRNAILSGVFPPGSQLRQEDLADKYEMSRTAVRFAIQALADDGLVEIGDTRRSFVADVTETHAEEIFDIIAVLEPYSAGLAAERATDDQAERDGPDQVGDRDADEPERHRSGSSSLRAASGAPRRRSR